ncbi:MAG: acetamidase/formamidase family protein [Erysipelotrichaceae bacterium]|jgi:amidase
MLEIRDTIYAFSKNAKPVAHIKNGETVKFITEDCFGGQIKSEEKLVGAIDWNNVNPATGPVYVEDAEPGDVIVVDILSIDVKPQGIGCTIPGASIFDGETEIRTKVLEVKDGYVHYNDIKWPANPMIGVIGCAPAGDDVVSGMAGNHGGNMDSKIITRGAKVYLPVRVKGGLLALGDLHASMADGEMIGAGVEIAGEVIATVSLIKNFKLNWPVTETKDAFYVNTSAPSYDEAAESGYREIHRLIMNAYGWDFTDAAIYMSLQGDLCANQTVLMSSWGYNIRVGTPKVPSKKRLIG